MRVIIDLPEAIDDHLSYLINERERERRISTSPLAGAPKLSRSALLKAIIEIGFEGFIMTYPTAQSLLPLRGWDRRK